MGDRPWVVDASVLGAAFFEEVDTIAARTFLARETHLIAPSLLSLEIASIAAKKVWKDLASHDVASRAVAETPRLIALVEPLHELAQPAFTLASGHRFSVYDASYLALAVKADATLITADKRLKFLAGQCGLAEKVFLLGEAV